MWFTTAPKYLVGFSLAWLAAICLGFSLLGAYGARPGRPGTPPVRWPGGCPISLDPDRPTLLIFLHPRCPCSRASVEELASIAASCGDRFAIHAILYRPEHASEEWDRGDILAADETSIPGLRRWIDRGGSLGRRFGVETSGHILLFDPAGDRLFGGGITPWRGHRGENPGLDALVARIEGRQAGSEPSPIFGCPILGPGSASRPEVIR